MRMKQIQVSRGPKKSIFWIEDDPRIKQGNSLKVKGSPEWWNIDHVHEQKLGKEDINREWKVGGL
jgi:hypothetical protein